MNGEYEVLLRDLASSLGVTVEYLWGALVRLQRWKGVTYLAQVAVLAAWTWFGLRPLARKWFKVPKRGQFDMASGEQIGAIVLSLVTGLVWILMFASAGELVGLLDPEAAAVRDLAVYVLR